MSEIIRYSWSHEAILKCTSMPGRSFACGPTGDAAQQIRIDRGDRVISRDSTGRFEQYIDRDTCVRFRSVRAARKSNTEMIGDCGQLVAAEIGGDSARGERPVVSKSSTTTDVESMATSP